MSIAFLLLRFFASGLVFFHFFVAAVKCCALGEEKRYLTTESRDDPRVKEVIYLLINWLNEELAQQRIVVKHIQEDLYDGQVIQKLIEKLANIKVCSLWHYVGSPVNRCFGKLYSESFFLFELAGYCCVLSALSFGVCDLAEGLC